jgi:hypothetical protein
VQPSSTNATANATAPAASQQQPLRSSNPSGNPESDFDSPQPAAPLPAAPLTSVVSLRALAMERARFVAAKPGVSSLGFR